MNVFTYWTQLLHSVVCPIITLSLMHPCVCTNAQTNILVNACTSSHMPAFTHIHTRCLSAGCVATAWAVPPCQTLPRCQSPWQPFCQGRQSSVTWTSLTGRSIRRSRQMREQKKAERETEHLMLFLFALLVIFADFDKACQEHAHIRVENNFSR